MPNSQTLKSKQQEIENSYPIYLETLDMLSSFGTYAGEAWLLKSDPQQEHKDNTGKSYIHGVGVKLNSYNTWFGHWTIEYFLDQKYSKLKGILVLG